MGCEDESGRKVREARNEFERDAERHRNCYDHRWDCEDEHCLLGRGTDTFGPEGAERQTETVQE